MTVRNTRVFRFGVFEADEQTGELRKQGRKVSLQGQPFEILVMLLERPGELVGRNEIQQRVWPEGTFVDFDRSLNTAVNKIRETLTDSAANPRYIETLARRGYRFIAPVTRIDASAATSGAGVSGRGTAGISIVASAGAGNEIEAENGRHQSPQLGSFKSVLTAEAELPVPSHKVVRVLFLLLQVMYFSFYVAALARLQKIEEITEGVFAHPLWVIVLLIVTAVIGIPMRLYLISAAAFGAPGLREKFLRLFAVIFPLDELWALSPFLLLPWIGWGLALASTAILLYVPFAERSLILMGAGRRQR